MCLNIQPDFPFVWSRHADIWQAHTPTDLARFKQWTGQGFCCSAIARLIGLPLQLDCMVWESPGFLVFHQTSPEKSNTAFQSLKLKEKQFCQQGGVLPHLPEEFWALLVLCLLSNNLPHHFLSKKCSG